ncbi:MAG TPA: ABC transporter permease [Candidatus Borkfalkia excrementigallinarum]|uniref:ABC transporter permease n=1 Tax=Candidatus Borkfalkia excrementigallinarum TaxID=2838506 RepID=A0A9D1ZVG4_9FIRM|nr:ABC transporter permease [Candidatus Borkfalkia excrementigallinarum]
MRKFNKNIAKEFKTSFGRFIAIMAIIALGVGFLIGVTQATPDMKNTMSRYLIDNNAYDVDVKGTFGLTQADIDAIAALEGVDSVMPVISTDAVVTAGGQELVGRIVGIENIAGYGAEESAGESGEESGEESGGSKQAMLNTLTLLEGEWPNEAGEVVVEQSTNYFEELKVGDTITLPETLDNTSATYGDVYAAKTFTVVGIVSSPDYFYKDAREVTTLGSGVVGAVVYGEMSGLYDLQKSGSVFSFLSNDMIAGFLGVDSIDVLYTDCYVRIADAESYERFNEGYKDFVMEKADAIENIAGTQKAPFLQWITAAQNNDMASGALGQMGITADSVQWLVLDRANSNTSYVSFDMNVEKVEEIAGIFPVFFIVVAALVALTSMTRMVEEDRMQIGTFKALGYGKGRIMSKYLIYCCLASIIGCVAGILIGFSLLPSIFWQAYGSLYSLPSLILAFSPWFAVIVFAVALAGTAIVTWATCRNSLKEKPSALMQPKSPKPGKRIWLERIGFIWNHLKFKWKSTLRNIFRYKKNMILTIVSVMGCTALILTGFGLNDSVVAVTDIQYSNIIRYDAAVEYSGDLSQIESGALHDFLDSSESYLSVYAESGTLILDGNKSSGRETVELYVVEDASQFNSFIDLHERRNSAIIDVTKGDDNVIVLPENIAIVYGLSAGDEVTYVSGGQEVRLTVYAVCENYTGAYAYMSSAAYAAQFGALPADNTILVKSGVAESDVDATTRTLLADPNVSAVSFIYSSIDTFAGLESTMGLVIAVLVLCAGALAAIVLYNLTNINIDERRREIATLRVLGYRRYEVAGYIYRESAILTLAGTLLGLGLGFLLHWFIVSRVNSVAMMFGRVISVWSYLWAFLLTIAFAVIVYAFMLIKLNRINMAESLKSNE